MEENQSHSTVSSLLVQRLQQQVENNLQNEQFGVEQLAENMGISRSQLHRKLKKSIGQSANQFIREYRLQRALKLLRQDDVTVSEVAFAVGFGSHSYFTTCFTEHFGYPPGEVRNRLNEASHDTMAPSSSSEPIQVQVEGVSEAISSAADISIKENSEQKVRKYKQIILGVAAVMLMSLGYIYYSNSIESETLNISEPEIIEKSIAVLPFVNMSNDPDQEVLCDGLTEAIIHHLSKIKSFDKVISRSSVMSLKGSDKTLPEIAALLKVNIVLEGSFRCPVIR